MEHYTIVTETKRKFLKKEVRYKVICSDIDKLRAEYPTKYIPNAAVFSNPTEAVQWCKKLNNYIEARPFRIFKDGNDRFFICKKGLHDEGGYEDKNGVNYSRLTLFMNRCVKNTDFTDALWLPLVPVKEDVGHIEDGFKTLQEACDMLEEIEQYYEREVAEIQRQRLIEEKKKIGTPVDCV